MRNTSKSQKIGILAVGISITITSVWAFWGASETFHEGWYYESFMMNVGLMIIQYLGPMLIFMGVGIISIYWPRAGGGIHAVVALFAAWFFNIFANTVIIFILIPLVGIGMLYWFGTPPPRQIALRWMIGFPLLVALIAGAVPAYRVSQRITDGSHDAQLVQGNGITLTWASTGPGWPQKGTNWHEAVQICDFLSFDGVVIASEPQNIWRLPTVDEAVRSMALHGENSHGIWDEKNEETTYEKRPDKEPPLWEPRSQVIYWWTATEIDEKKAYMIVYDGKVWARTKETDIGSLGFRCVK